MRKGIIGGIAKRLSEKAPEDWTEVRFSSKNSEIDRYMTFLDAGGHTYKVYVEKKGSEEPFYELGVLAPGTSGRYRKIAVSDDDGEIRALYESISRIEVTFHETHQERRRKRALWKKRKSAYLRDLSSQQDSELFS